MLIAGSFILLTQREKMSLSNEEMNAIRIAADVIRARPDMLAGLATDEDIAKRLLALAKTIFKQIANTEFGDNTLSR